MPQDAEKEKKICPSIPPDIIINLLRLIFRKKKGSVHNDCFGSQQRNDRRREPLISRVLCGRSEQ